MEKRLRINNFIRVPEVSVIDDAGKPLGTMKLSEAMRIALERELDLVEVGPMAQPPIAKIMDYGKYVYQKQRQEKKAGSRPKEQETKTIRVGFKTGAHDLAVKARKADEFLAEGHLIKTELTLRGREKAMAHLGLPKLKGFLTMLTQPFVTQGEPKRGPYGWVVMIQPDKKAAQRKEQTNPHAPQE